MPRPTAPVLEPSRDPALAAKFAALFAPGGITNTLVTDQQQFTEGPSVGWSDLWRLT